MSRVGVVMLLFMVEFTRAYQAIGQAIGKMISGPL